MKELGMEQPVRELLEIRARSIGTMKAAGSLAAGPGWDLSRTEKILRRDWEMEVRARRYTANARNWQAANRRTLLEGLRERLQGCIAFLKREEERGDLAPGFVAELQADISHLIGKYSRSMEAELRAGESLFKLIEKLRQLEKEGPFGGQSSGSGTETS